MKLTQLIQIIAVLIFCLPAIAYAKPTRVQAGRVTIIRDANGSIQVDTGNTRIVAPRQPIEPEIDNDYSVNNTDLNLQNSTQTIQNSRCGTRSVQSTQQSNIRGSGRTVTQTNISTNICQ